MVCTKEEIEQNTCAPMNLVERHIGHVLIWEWRNLSHLSAQTGYFLFYLFFGLNIYSSWKFLGGCPVSMKAKPMTPQLRVPQADCFRKCSCLVSSMSYCFRGFNLGPLDDYNVQLLVPTVGSVLHTHPTGAWLPHVATDSNRVRSGPRLVTASTETWIDTGAQFSVITRDG